jgi:predicted glycoside hydrolase/deacetylase ChbG (UPF0249 family)
MRPTRSLVVMADDFGIGPETSRGILDLAAEGRVTATVLLVNSPYAESSVAAWERAGRSVELGWHPCLTLDAPILPPSAIRSLVGSDGRFLPLSRFLRRMMFGGIRTAEVAAEWDAQRERFTELVGHPPSVVAAHHHVAVFGPVRRALLALLADQSPRPYLRRVVEPAGSISRTPGARFKRSILSWFGRRTARHGDRLGLSGSKVLAGITDPPRVADENFFASRLAAVPGETVELMCHPGHPDESLTGRDDANAAHRIHELHLLRSPDFAVAIRRAGFRLTAPAELCRLVRQAA